MSAAIAAKAGYPSVMVPGGFISGSDGKDTPDYPLGVTFEGRAWSEYKLLRLSYPGLRVPRPLRLVPHENSDSWLPKLAEVVLALTKVIWNSTSLTRSFPISSRPPAKSGAFSNISNTGYRPRRTSENTPNLNRMSCVLS